jgi:hypothetical protein
MFKCGLGLHLAGESTWIESSSLTEITPLYTAIPGGLVVRIRRSHRRGRGSIPRLGRQVHFAFFKFLLQCSHESVHC